MYPHRIRLRGPWEYERLDRTGEFPLSGRVVMPCAAGDLGAIAGRLRFKRRFGYPGRIDAHERVWLIFEGVKAPVEISVNGVDLGRHSSGNSEMDVSNLLQARNELTADVTLGAGAGLWSEAALEVRCTAYLRGIGVAVLGEQIHATGEVVGGAEGPLELYLVADRSPVGYAKVATEGGIHSFDLRADSTNAEGISVRRVKIDLVQGASVWYTVELDVPEEGSGGDFPIPTPAGQSPGA